jgi:hypothetical protein
MRQSTKPKPPPDNLSDTNISKISELILNQLKRIDKKTKYAPVMEILSLLGKGAVIAAAILAPKSAKVLYPLMQQSPDFSNWKKYNLSYLKRTLSHLEKTKKIERIHKGGVEILKLSYNGKVKLLKYSLDQLHIDKPKKWDGKWRLVLYDVPKSDKSLGDAIRKNLLNFDFYPIQESVYIYPFPCFDQIEFLRQYYHLGSNVQYMVVDKIENDTIYKDFFGI